MMEITITLRIDFDTANKPEKEPIMLDMARGKAKELLTLGMLLKDKREPQISFQCGDFFATTEEVDLFNEGER